MTAVARNWSVSVGAVATKLTDSGGSRRSVTVVNRGAEVLFVGAPGVTAGNGVPVPANGGSFTDEKYQGELWGIVVTGPVDVRVWEVG